MKKNLILAAILGIIGISLGAFGTHTLADKLSAEAMNSFDTAVQYQLYHILVLLFVNTYSGFSDATKKNISLIFFLGILFFSGSIYLIYIAGVAAKSIWFVTPLGGLLFIAGWVYMLISFIKK